MSDHAATLARSERQLLLWLAEQPRTYEETMAAWRSSCPRLSIWEDALLAGLVAVGADGAVRVTRTGRDRLARP